MKKLLAIILSIMVVLSIALPASAFSTVAVKSIKLSSTKITLKVGQTSVLKVAFTPAKTTQKKLTYVTSNKNVATINAAGKITAVGAGTTTITVYTSNRKIYAKCTVTVTKTVLKPVNLKIVMAGDKPKDQQIVLDEIGKRTKDELNIKLEVDYIPWADYLEKTKMMAAGGDAFDIFLNFSFDITGAYTRKQAIRMNDLFAKYGQDIKANISDMEIKSGFVGKDQVAIPAVYTKDNIAITGLIRKDLRIKYKVPEIKDLAGMAKYLEAIKANEPGMIPMGSDAHNASTFFGRAVPNNRPYDASSVAGWYKDGKDKSIKVFNRYNPKSADKALADICADGYKKGWFEKDVLSQKDSKGLFIAGKAAALNMDLYNFGSIEQALKANFPKAELEWAVINPTQPINYEKSNNYTQISSTSKNPDRAMMFLNWLQKSQKNYDLYMFGIEGKHYTLQGNLLKLPAGVDATNNPYAPTPWFAYNTKWHRLTSSESPLTVSATKYFNDAKRNIDDPRLNGFSFVPDKVTVEIGQCEKIITEQWYPILIGVLSGEEAYNKFLSDLDKAGAPAIIAEVQRQLDEYLAK